jgi:biopolymer transport protein ExbB/TolQ
MNRKLNKPSTKGSNVVRELNWSRSDPEQALGFRGGKYTDVNAFLSFAAACLLTALFFGLLALLRSELLFKAPSQIDLISVKTAIFLDRGVTPYFIIFLTAWSMSIIGVKSKKLKLQRRSLNINVVPHAHNFELTHQSALHVLERLHELVDNPQHFVLLSRIERALSGLKNVGLISEVDNVLRSQAQNDDDHLESSYSLLRGFIWAIPVLGFIGTVLGLSGSIGNLGKLLSTDAEMENISDALIPVTNNLSVAFDTTLLALVCSLVVHLLMTQLKKSEEGFLDECKEYCHANIVSKLRLVVDPTPAAVGSDI